MKDNIILWTALWGKVFGYFFVALPYLWDIVNYGVRTNEGIKVCGLGVICQLIGMALVTAGYLADRRFR